MPGAYKRKGATNYTGWYVDATGKRVSFAGLSTKEATMALVNKLQTEARLIRDGVLNAHDVAAKDAARTPIGEFVSSYCGSIREKGGTDKHATHIGGTLTRLFESANIRSTADLNATKIERALAKIRQAGKSPRTRNHAKNAAVAFCSWLWNRGHIKEPVRGLDELGHLNQEASRVRVRRALTAEEFDKLIAAAESGPTITLSRRGYNYEHVEISGPDRAMLYRIAANTGFRANEIRSLTPESFALSDRPTITVNAGDTKNGRKAVQPIARRFAEVLRPWLATRAPGKPVVPVPEKTAKLLRHDLKRAGIPVVDSRGQVMDFHAFRKYYITELIRRGVKPAVAQQLARHSDVNLTMRVYTDLGEDDLRRAIDE